MNIPIGKVVEEHQSLSDNDPFAKMEKLLKSGFNGYLVATIEGVTGLEEGVLMMKQSQVVGVVFDALRFNKQLYGLKALRLVLNILKAKKGVFDLNKLSKQQIDLIMAFNEKIRLPKEVDRSIMLKLKPSEYKADLVSKELAVDLSQKDTRYNLLKKLGLGSI